MNVISIFKKLPWWAWVLAGLGLLYEDCPRNGCLLQVAQKGSDARLPKSRGVRRTWGTLQRRGKRGKQQMAFFQQPV
jgi:hypothetical protein